MAELRFIPTPTNESQRFASNGTDTDKWSIQGRRFNSSGTAKGSQIQVNYRLFTTFNQQRPSVGSDEDGGFVVFWTSFDSGGADADGYSIQGQRFSSIGSSVGSEFLVNSYTTSNQEIPSIGRNGNRGFVVIWNCNGSSGSDSDQYSIHGQRFDADSVFEDGFESGDLSSWSSSLP